MNANRITLFCSIALFLFTFWAKLILSGTPSVHGRYYLTVILTISGLLITITLFRMIRSSKTAISEKKWDRSTDGDQRRSFYRICFEPDERPLFIQRNDPSHMGSDTTFPVSDISETGIGLASCDAYHIGQTVVGEVIFKDGATASVNGIVTRQSKDLVALYLHCAIEPSLLIKVQRDQIERKKKMGARPAVDPTIVDQKGQSLPSHTPKGVCRMKRS